MLESPQIKCPSQTLICPGSPEARTPTTFPQEAEKQDGPEIYSGSQVQLPGCRGNTDVWPALFPVCVCVCMLLIEGVSDSFPSV